MKLISTKLHIAIEGCDGVGKETQSNLLRDYFTTMNLPTEVIHFPNYGTPQCELIEQYLKGSLTLYDIRSMAMLFAIERHVSLNQKMNEKKYPIRIFDRFTFSNMNYTLSQILLDKYKTPENFIAEYENFQNTEEALIPDMIEFIEHTYLGIPKPDITIYLDLATDTAKKLIHARKETKDINEQNDKLQEMVNLVGYILAKKTGAIIINCNDGENINTVENIHNMILEKLNEVLTIDLKDTLFVVESSRNKIEDLYEQTTFLKRM